MTCGKCRHLSVPLDKAGRRVPRKQNAYRCEVEFPMPEVPACVSKSHDWRWPPYRSWMSPSDGVGCQFFRSLKDADTQFDDAISADSESGRLDPLFDAARQEIDNGNVSDATPGDKP